MPIMLQVQKLLLTSEYAIFTNTQSEDFPAYLYQEPAKEPNEEEQVTYLSSSILFTAL